MNRRYKKYTSFLDRFPIVIFILIVVMSIILLFSFKNKYPLHFFSGTELEEEAETNYSIFITSPSDNEIFNFINQNETVPIIIKAKGIENLGYDLEVLVNDNNIKKFNSPPYEYTWNPKESDEYIIVANLIDNNDNIIADSNEITFIVNYDQEKEEDTTMSMDIEKKKKNALEQSGYRTQNGSPIFAYKCYQPPVIDGSMQEWDNFEKFTFFNPTIQKENYYSHTDISGTFYSCWDENNFYFAIQVEDDVFSQPYTDNQIYKGDSIVLVFDTELEEDMQIPFYNTDDYQIDLSPGNFTTDLPEESFISWPPSFVSSGVNITSTKTANGYQMEVSLPWHNLTNYSPQDEDVLGFTVSIFDKDNLESYELVISSSTQFELNNVFTLGTIVIIDAGDIQTMPEEESDTSE